MIVEAEIGKRLKKIRRQKNLTLKDLAERTGYSKGYLSKVETSEKSPPVGTLGVLARELGVTVSGILGEDSIHNTISVVRKKDRKLMGGSGEEFGYAYEALANPYPNKHMEPFILSYPSDYAINYNFKHDGEEMLFVLQGKIHFKYGEREFSLEEGDCVYFDSSVPHTGEPIGDEELKCIVVIYNASPKGQVNHEHVQQRIVKE